jgi:multimeric flavodoxin WrbA
MKVIGIMASPRKNGNVDTLVQEVLDGASEAGHDIEKFSLNEMNCSGCQACMFCKKSGYCRQDDDLSALMKTMEGADAVVFGSPIYYLQFCSQFRMFLDRLYMFLGTDFKVSLTPGKKAVVITSQGNPDAKMFGSVFNEFDKVLQMYGFEIKGEIHIENGNKPSAVRERTDLLKEARSLGANL